ncbi:hypothetical protein MMC07_000398 [Pseudocyphellaria aurata]|nr:hypothetical protein [Pseudocyphellaria aurata]
MPPGFLGNNILSAMPSVVADGATDKARAAERPELMHALATTVKAVRESVVDMRRPGAALEAMCAMDQGAPFEAHAAMLESLATVGLDLTVTNWNHHARHHELDFGTGPVPRPNAHVGIQRHNNVGVVDLPQGTGLRMCVLQSRLSALVNSPVFSQLAPASGIMQGILWCHPM